MKKLVRFLGFCVAALLLASCSEGDKFSIMGSVNGPVTPTAYLMRNGLDKTECVDSATIRDDGSFYLSAHRPSSPEFYTVVINGHSYWFSVDSTEAITMSADSSNWDKYEVTGSENTIQILDVQNRIEKINQSLTALMKNYQDGQISHEDLYNKVYEVVAKYKSDMKDFIQNNSASAVSYYILFKQLPYGIKTFDPYTAEDYHYFVLVANAWNKRYPESYRAKQLKNLMADAKKQIKANQAMAAADKGGQTGIIDLVLPDYMGRKKKLSDLKDKTVLLEFCYMAQMGDEALSELESLNTKYKNEGLEIYMVNFDQNINVWRQKAAKCPWTTVLDMDESSYLTYNLSFLPTNYLISANGNIIGRDVSIDEVEGYMNGNH